MTFLHADMDSDKKVKAFDAPRQDTLRLIQDSGGEAHIESDKDELKATRTCFLGVRDDHQAEPK